jgi:hypothetical protein
MFTQEMNNMYVICIDANGFEDQLTYESVYMVEEIGENGYKIYDDNEVPRWYGNIHFARVDPSIKE